MDPDTTGSAHPLRLTPGSADRRRHARFVLPAGYTPLRIRFLDDDAFTVDGTAYDISMGGVRFEADRGVEPGTTVALQIEVPGLGEGSASGPAGPGRAVFVFATVVWIEDEDEPGPVKMAAVFSRFARAGDEQRLHAAVATGRYRRAA